MISISLMDLPWLGVRACVRACVRARARARGVNRKRKWVFSYVMQRFVPTHTVSWGH
jgi:hypothetical protein